MANHSAVRVSARMQGVATGISVIASVLLLVVSVLSVLEGAVALAGNAIYVAEADDFYSLDTDTWGWIHLLLGVGGVFSALGLLFGTRSGRGSAVLVAALVIVANVVSLPYYPAWSLLVISSCVMVIWAAVWQPRT
ncbi:DUF7144 family membrane protein [Nocardia takedensis]|uniref:DUF7144 family membrane protein n=1 Tax=Nocardia takedensis TaxID=259390 RepID=UPI0005927BDD|nr:hypothetical protein [Nocardia takedensis]